MTDKGLVLSSVDAVNLSFYFIVIFITKHKQEKWKYILRRKGKICNFLKNSLQESLLLAPIVILITLFCNLKILMPYEEFT